MCIVSVDFIKVPISGGRVYKVPFPIPLEGKKFDQYKSIICREMKEPIEELVKNCHCGCHCYQCELCTIKILSSPKLAGMVAAWRPILE